MPPRGSRSIYRIKDESEVQRPRPKPRVRGERNKVPPKPKYVDPTGLDRIPPTQKRKRDVDRYAAAPLGLALFGDPDIQRGFRDTRGYVQYALDLLQSPEASRKERLTVGADVGLLIGGISPLGRGKRAGKVRAPKKAPLPEGAERVVGELKGARKLRGKQEQLYRAERGKRAARAEEAARVGGQEGYQAALAELKGELPKLRFGALEGELDQPVVDRLFTFIQRETPLRPFEKIRAQTALKNTLEGRVPTRSEIKLLERVFGPDVSAQIAESVPFWQKAKNLGFQIINVPRALKASYDISAPFRQGLVLGARHPRMFAREWGPMLKSFRSERAYTDVMDEITSRPTFPVMQESKLALTDLENLATREEAFMSNLAEKIPVVGRGVRGSSRAYTAFLNKFRADAFDYYLRTAEAQGLDITNKELLKSISRWVNNATGRGGSGQFVTDHAVLLNSTLFSPRLMAARLNVLNPKFYYDLDPFVRKQALRGAANTLGAISLTLWLAKLNGAEVGMDPRSANFGKIKVGNTRVDIAGGFQQYIVLAARLIKGEMVSSTSGNVTELEGGFGKPTRFTALEDFLKNKAAPVTSYGIAGLEDRGADIGDPFRLGPDTARLFLPLNLEGAYDTGSEYGYGPAGLGLGLGSVGFSVQTYGPPKKKSGRKRSGRDGRKSIYRRGGGSSSSIYR